LSRVVSRLVKMGLVSRTRSTTNSREVVVQLTAKGVAILARVIPRAIAAEQTAIAGVSARDLAVVRRSLRRMYENLASSRVSERSEARLRGSAAAAVLSRPRRAGGRIRR
jgi:DNA-binding MarR family transcriptional regulator